MATDVLLDQVDGTYLVFEGRVVKSEASDFMIDSADRRKGGGPYRRAFVHDEGDGLTINFNGDYPGGLTLTNVAQIVPQPAAGAVSVLMPTLVVRGGISYEVKGVTDVKGGFSPTLTVNVADEFSKLQAQIADLTAKVDALTKK